MATTLTLPSRRFVAQVNSGAPEAKANYKTLAQRNAIALEACPWREVTDDSVMPSLVEHDFSTVFSDDKYDAFCMTGLYSPTDRTEVAYAGMAAYRFALPWDYLHGDASLVAASVTLSRDRFLLPGLRLSAVLSDSATPSTAWDVVRGDAEGCIRLSAQLHNPADRITAAEPATVAVSVDLSDSNASAKRDYLWIYVTVEDYTATWTWYSSTQHRLYAIEGSGMVISQSSSVEFSADVSPDDPASASFPVFSGGVRPYIADGSPLGERHVVVRADSNLVAETDGQQTPEAAVSRFAAASALARAYAAFYTGGGDTPTADGYEPASGAAFNVAVSVEEIPAEWSDKPVATSVVRIDSSVLVVPFVRPSDATAARLRLSFPALSLPAGARYNVFLASPSEYILALTADQLKSPGLYDGGDGSPFALLGTITRGTSAEFALPRGEGRMGTLVISAWLPPEAFDLKTGGSRGTGPAGFLPDITILATH